MVFLGANFFFFWSGLVPANCLVPLVERQLPLQTCIQFAKYVKIQRHTGKYWNLQDEIRSES